MSLPLVKSREERRVRTSLERSGLPTGQTLASFGFAFQPSVERNRIDPLATCAWLRAKETLLIQGPPGVGKGPFAISVLELVEDQRQCHPAVGGGVEVLLDAIGEADGDLRARID